MASETKTVREWLDWSRFTKDASYKAAINAALVDYLADVLAQQPWDDWKDNEITVNLEREAK